MKPFFNWCINKWIESIQLRLTIYFLLILAPLVSISLYANYESKSILERHVNERIQNAMSGTMEYVDLTVLNVEELSMIVATDDNINQQLSLLDTKTFPEANFYFSKVLASISNVNTINPLLAQISILHASSGVLLSTRFGGKQIDNFEEQPWYLETKNKKKGTSIWLIPQNDQPDFDVAVGPIFSKDSITLLRQMDYFTPNPQNLIMFTINKQKLLQMIGNLTRSDKEHIYLYTEEGQLVVSNSEHPMPVPLEAYDEAKDHVVQTELDQNHEFILTRVTSHETGWSLVLVQPVQEIYHLSNNLRQFTYYIIVISIVLATIISWVVYRGIAAPLSSLAYGMKHVRQGNLNTRLPIDRKDDFGNLTRSFNDMVQEQQHLIQNNYEQQLLMAKTELQLLQSQINPHFLYNTLDSIYWKAENYDAKEISEMVLNLSKFFRTSLSKGKEVFTVQETMEHLGYYLRVQQLRYGDHFNVKFQVAEDCRQIPLLKLLLQPIVENAILHGLEKNVDGGELIITSGCEDGILKLVVQDDGKGMKADRLQFILQQLDKVTYADYKGGSRQDQDRNELFGLKNVKARLKLFYKNQADLTIESTLDVGTIVTISIPLHSYHELALD
ncbi:sensor histidine kinase [Paenibacillus eucommiae]|uniref:Two-component system sensor histidine kinase YesM n=1 Tax=Paenibacillus eucommiae TaxID=1355755 RepID=A0ABS4JA09_9BACL|nr:sensor histidine kinase [Paenibacillus eucommiae]MBP1996677.1 two-component system sensor histidine kinase YesM [Paenibacillus eucommiae]